MKETGSTFGAAAFVSRHRRRLLWALGVGSPVLALLVAGIYVIDEYWPYRHPNLKPFLEQVLASRITVSAYHRTSTERLTFTMPGASADQKGIYDLRNGTVHLVGEVKMDSDISHVTTGFKSLLLKPLAPFFKTERCGCGGSHCGNWRTRAITG